MFIELSRSHAVRVQRLRRAGEGGTDRLQYACQPKERSFLSLQVRRAVEGSEHALRCPLYDTNFV